MSLFGSLYTGVSALSAQSQATAIISNNIANVNTTGFKRSEASFESLVTSQGRASRYSPGTVAANRLQRVDQQGPIQQSISTTDVSVSGNGFFAIKRDTDDSALSPYLYTRNGQFSENAEGFLRNSAGFYLYGWPIDQNGELPANQGDLTSLVPVDVAFLGGLTRPTTTAEIAANLDSRETDETRSSALTSAVDFQRGLTVYDSLGNGQPITFEFVKTYGPMATAPSTRTSLSATDELIADLNLTNGDEFTIATDTVAAVTFEIIAPGGTATVGNTGVSTIGEMIDAINSAFSGEATAFLGNDGEIIIQRDNFDQDAASTLTITDSAGSALADLGFTPGAFQSSDMSTGITDYDNGSPTDTPPYSNAALNANFDGSFPAFQNFPGDGNYNARGWWQVRIRDPQNNVLTQGLLNFNRDGTINAVPDLEGNVDIELNSVDWGNGSELQSFDIDISRFSQFSSDYTVLFSDQNGAELGLRTGVSIDEDGFVIAQFSNGATSKLYKVPLVTFANPNGLQEISGTAYMESEESGEENMREAGTGGAGSLEPSTLEISNVDLADEFSRLIIAQRAYSAGTKIINTVDQMTEELLRLR